MPIAGEVDLGGGSAAGPADGMIIWLGLPEPGLVRPCVCSQPAGACGVLGSAHDGGVDRDFPVEFVDRFGDHANLPTPVDHERSPWLIIPLATEGRP
jgi:hypothetical protein